MTQPAVLALVDHHDGVVRAPAFELLTLARSLGPVEAVWLGSGLADALDLLAEHGVSTVHQVDLEADVTVATSARALAEIMVESGATTVLLSSTFENKEVAALTAHETGAGLSVDAAGLERSGEGRLVVHQQAFAATWTLQVEITTPRAVVAVKPNAVPAEAEPTGQAPQVVVHALVSPPAARTRVVERTVRPSSGRPELGEAQVVVAGGRGTEGDFSAVEELAEVLGGAVGATRVATDEGWIGHETQIGQTGVTISPRLYVGAGVSGAVHHRGGMQSSGTIVAVNADPEAPIFEIADFGVVGDLFSVLPQAAAELRRLKAEQA
ncbi:electron transfer flavoprotein subunit alpha/FixB family protein [Actinotalea sp. BY-33]|uniref:Electron transfer flavoprotein subunit alpha/FixB family protein n=1 Tax=Actinotalea soli TaxID=2819234 RepID=A0A939LMZ4_9CELL|nr:electron transfer flavoprotein subunit alpha/FixB family protein [Actinotalea soli]MBO1750831.1 electron transfer flavoprotein subunit alpha/FixB family protein [Actinotalea soli]